MCPLDGAPTPIHGAPATGRAARIEKQCEALPVDHRLRFPTRLDCPVFLRPSLPQVTDKEVLRGRGRGSCFPWEAEQDLGEGLPCAASPLVPFLNSLGPPCHSHPLRFCQSSEAGTIKGRFHSSDDANVCKCMQIAM